MPKSASQSPLKKREVEILRLTSQGMTKSEIAVALVLSVETVAWYGRQVFKKLEVKNWDDALAQAIALGVIDAPVAPEPIEAETSAADAEEAPADEPVIQDDEQPAQEQEAAAPSESRTEIPIVILPGVVEALAPPLLLAEPGQPAESSASEEKTRVPVYPTTEFEVTGPLPTFDEEASVPDSTVIAPATYALSDEFDLAGAIAPAKQPPQPPPTQWDFEILSTLAGSSSHPHHGEIDDEDWNMKSLSAPSNDLMLFDALADDTGVFGPTEAVPNWAQLSPNSPAKVEAVPEEPNADVNLVVNDEEIERNDTRPVEDQRGDEAARETIGDELGQDQPSEWSAEAAQDAIESEKDVPYSEEVDALPNPEPVEVATSDSLADEVIAAMGVQAPIENLPARMLPLPTGAFIGRDQEMRELKELLVDQRVIHLTGLPGVGKTRLALEAANQLRDEFAGGVHYLYLPSVTQAALQVAVALHLIGNPHGRTLLILDHADRISRPSAIAAELLSARSDLQIVVTSRDWIGISGAAELKVLPLEVPSVHPRKAPNWSSLLESAAMRLFVKATEQALPGYSLRESDATALGHLCGRSQGIPVLIELLAAHLRVYPPSIILMQLDNRLRGLGGGRSDPSRQQSLNGILGWSQNLLKRDEQLALAGLSLFVGDWTEDGAAAVLSQFVKSAMGEILSQLAHKRFIQIVSAKDEQKRYSMSDAVRDFAATKLHQHELYQEILRAFASAFWTMIENFGSDQERWLASIEAEIDNIRSVLRLAVEHRAGEALTRMTLGLWPLWEATERFDEADYWFSLALAQAGQKNQNAQGRIRLISANVALRRGEHEQARKLLEECLVVYRLSGDHANERHVLALLRQIMTDHPGEQTNP